MSPRSSPAAFFHSLAACTALYQGFAAIFWVGDGSAPVGTCRKTLSPLSATNWPLTTARTDITKSTSSIGLSFVEPQALFRAQLRPKTFPSPPRSGGEGQGEGVLHIETRIHLRNSAARSVFSISIATVIGPTPPGTGVMCDARSFATANSTSP